MTSLGLIPILAPPKADDATRLNELENENARLKRVVADQALDVDLLKELNRGDFSPRIAAGGQSVPSMTGSGSPSAGLAVVSKPRSTLRLPPRVPDRR